MMAARKSAKGLACALRSLGAGLDAKFSSNTAMARHCSDTVPSSTRTTPFHADLQPVSASTRKFAATASQSTGPICIVTGSATGLGKAIALSLGSKGARVVLNDPKSAEATAGIEKQIKQAGGDAISVKADVTKKEDVQALFDGAITKWQTVDVLVNNAGIQRPGPLVEMDPTHWQEVIDTNLTAVFTTTQAALKIMTKKKAGRILNISSVCGVVGCPTHASYSAAKAGVIGLTKVTAKECAALGIACNAIAPGLCRTPFTEYLDEEYWSTHIPMGRFGDPEEVAELVQFLALSRGGGYITGQVVRIDGGMFS